MPLHASFLSEGSCSWKGPSDANSVEWFCPRGQTQQDLHQQEQQKEQGQHVFKRGQQERNLLMRRLEGQRLEQQLHALHSSEVRSVVLRSHTIQCIDLGTSKTGIATAVRRLPSTSRWPSAPVAAAEDLHQHFEATEELLLSSADLTGVFSVAQLKVLQHERSHAALVSLLLLQRQRHQADLLMLGLPLNPILPRHLRFRTPRMLRHLSIARKLQLALAKAGKAKGTAPVSVLLADESYSTWTARRRQKETSWRHDKIVAKPVDSSAALELFNELLTAAAAPEGPTGVLRLAVPRAPLSRLKGSAFRDT
ncbi:uncharacterized protein LOC34623308 [Cyclospora cayetanensis]|uniref:Uncharacterized protein LOC34623308 n=1 Tax=Cyclospora cayetanensis TaxID=88456 RepID=A0A6P6S3P2_9EIME|nr:uncharacterized protein LOC34623308 [Cyclospora cayetanensis]